MRPLTGKARKLADELVDIIQEKYLHVMYGLRVNCVSHKNEVDDLKLLLSLHQSGISCPARGTKVEVKDLKLPKKPNIL